MVFTLLTIGKTHISFVREGIDEYKSRLVRYLPFEILELPDIKGAKSLTAEAQKIKEGEMIMSKLQPSDHVILLDERGREYTSLQYASQVEKLQSSGKKRTVFVIGGPYGFSEAIYSRADALLSLSKMTFNHEMVRLFFVEQIYRAMTILRGEPYHHE